MAAPILELELEENFETKISFNLKLKYIYKAS
jgi:hypothetical protein